MLEFAYANFNMFANGTTYTTSRMPIMRQVEMIVGARIFAHTHRTHTTYQRANRSYAKKGFIKIHPSRVAEPIYACVRVFDVRV